MSSIIRVHYSQVPTSEALNRFAVWPEPVDHDVCFQKAGFTAFADTNDTWDAEFDKLFDRLFSTLEERGPARLAGGELPVRRTGFLKPKEVGSLLMALLCAAQDDQFPPCSVEFGDPVSARVTTSDGHPILWIELSNAADFSSILTTVADGLPVCETSLEWELLLPRSAIQISI